MHAEDDKEAQKCNQKISNNINLWAGGTKS
jgi:hypothetical protein